MPYTYVSSLGRLLSTTGMRSAVALLLSNVFLSHFLAYTENLGRTHDINIIYVSDCVLTYDIICRIADWASISLT